jgi:hypothetical protein
MEALECRSCKEAELHHKPENACEYNGEGSPRRCGAQALPHNFDEDDKDIESEHQQKAIRDEDACDAGCGDENVLEVKGRKERADTEDDEKKEKLEDRKDGFFHG